METAVPVPVPPSYTQLDCYTWPISGDVSLFPLPNLVGDMSAYWPDHSRIVDQCAIQAHEAGFTLFAVRVETECYGGSPPDDPAMFGVASVDPCPGGLVGMTTGEAMAYSINNT